MRLTTIHPVTSPAIALHLRFLSRSLIPLSLIRISICVLVLLNLTVFIAFPFVNGFITFDIPFVLLVRLDLCSTVVCSPTTVCTWLAYC